MKIISVDDELGCLHAFRMICEDIPDVEYAAGFDNPAEALEYLKNNPVDIAFLDIEMPLMSGLEMAKKMKSIQPKTSVVFVTAYEQYAVQAFAVDACGYILKPYEKSEIIQKIQDVGFFPASPQKEISIHTFNCFELFVDGTMIHFSCAKAKELLAALVDHMGSIITTQQAIELLWPDRAFDNKTKALYRMTVSSLKKVLAEAEVSDILIDQWGSKRLNTSLVSCDAWTVLEGKAVKCDFLSENYLPMYPWSQSTQEKLRAFLDSKKQR